MDQSDTVRKQFIFSNISFYFFLRLKENHRGLQRIECCWQADSVPCPPASDQGIVTGQQPDSEAARCFLCNLGCLGICLFWEQGRCELSSPMTGGSWIVDSCHPSLPCKPSLSLTTHTSHAPFCYWIFLKKKKKKVLQSRYQPPPSNPLLSIISSIYLTSAMFSCGWGSPQLLGTHTLGFLLTEFIVLCLSSEW